MKLEDALGKIHAPKGLSTLLAAIQSADFDPVREPNALKATLAEAEVALKEANEKCKNATSDWAYWGYAGDAAYWGCVVDLLKAAELVGKDALPDVEAPILAGMVMDVQAKLEKWGKTVLAQAQEQAELRKQRTLGA